MRKDEFPIVDKMLEDSYEKGKADGAREFLAWYSGGETMPSFGRCANYKIDDVIAEWQKTYKQNVE